MYTKNSELVLIYDIGQLPALEHFLHERSVGSEKLSIISLDAEVDSLLHEKDIQFISARDHRAKNNTHYLFAEEWLSFLEGQRWKWFSYREIYFGKLFYPTLQGYIRQAIYYVDIIARVCSLHQELRRIFVLAPVQSVPLAGAYIAGREISVVGDCAKLIGKQLGIDVVVHEQPTKTTRRQIKAHLFFVQRTLFSFGLSFLNLCTNLLRPRGNIRILASDYWRNIAPVLEHIPGAEVILCDRKQILNVRLRNAWRYHMRFLSLDSYRTPNREQARQEALHIIEETWKKTHIPDSEVMCIGNISLEPLFHEVLNEVIRSWLSSILQKIDELYALVDVLQPDIIMLRATVSQQWHFPLLALIAQVLNIPSLELLHGMEYPGPGAIDKRHLARYLGVYGTHTQRQMLQAGFTKERLPIIGSPRFDLYTLEQYAQKRSERAITQSPKIFCTAPDLFLGAAFDTYDIEHYFNSVAHAVRKIPEASVLIKLRPGRHRESFYRQAIAEAFAGIPHTIAQFESLRSLFPQVDLAVSCQSTVAIEALQCGVPLVLFAATPVEALMLKYNFADFAAEHAVALCLNKEDLYAVLPRLASEAAIREGLSNAARVFLNREFAFDGKGALRTASFIHSLVEME